MKVALPLAATSTSRLADFSVTVWATESLFVTDTVAPAATEAGTVNAKPLMVIDVPLDFDIDIGLPEWDVDEPHPVSTADTAIVIGINFMLWARTLLTFRRTSLPSRQFM